MVTRDERLAGGWNRCSSCYVMYIEVVLRRVFPKTFSLEVMIENVYFCDDFSRMIISKINSEIEIKNRKVKSKIEIQNRKSKSKIEIENRNPKIEIRNRNPEIEIRNRNRNPKSKSKRSEIEIQQKRNPKNRNTKSKSEIEIQKNVIKCA